LAASLPACKSYHRGSVWFVDVMRARFAAGRRQNQDSLDFRIRQDWQVSITEWFQS